MASSCQDCTFEPPSELDQFHELDRHAFVGSDSPGKDPSVFREDMSDLITYGEGVAFPGAVLLVIGILLWIFIFIWSCCACVCGRCKCCHPSKKYAGFLGDPDFDKTEGNGKRCRAPCIPKGTHYSRKGFIIIWVLGILYCAIAALTIMFTNNLGDNLSDTADTAKVFNTIAQKAFDNLEEVELLRDGLDQTSTAAASDIQALANTEFVQNETSESAPLIETAASLLNDFGSPLDRMKSPLSSGIEVSDTFIGYTSDVMQYSTDASDAIEDFFFAYAAALIVVTLLLMISILPMGICKTVFKVTGTLNLIWLFLIYLIGALLLILMIVSADICQEPLEIASRMAGEGSAQDSIQYYSNCPSDSNLKPIGLKGFVQESVNDTSDLFDALNEVESKFNASKAVIEARLDDSADGYSQGQLDEVTQLMEDSSTKLTQLRTNTQSIETTLKTTASEVGCDSISEPTYLLVNTYCHDIMADDVLYFWVLQMALILLGSIIALSAICFCTDHTGKKPSVPIDY